MIPYYQDKWVTIYHGDCREILPQLDVKVDLVLTDPWYFPENQKTKNAFEDDMFWIITKEWLSQCVEHVKPTGHIFTCFSPQKMAKFEYLLSELALPLRSRVIWHYRNAGGRCADKGQFGKTYEMVYHIGFGNILNFPKKWGEERFDVWTIAIPQSNFKDKKIHPFQKPIELIKRLINIASNEGDLILDPFLGSGTTCYCAKKLNRYSIGIEIEEKYCEIAAKRCCQEVMELV